ncbi:WecB/TagA/CpsF family glycosyltransferase [Leptobacterium sp. I13]|uniref:WecB/TagA/CpsF family glycosyltransferase n=1 Tax=Leptobacterium meishanense TaxID=3128904 RepID=UPI0030ECFB1D
MKKINILNLSLNIATEDQALKKTLELAKNRTPSYICFTNAHMTVEANNDEYMLNVVNSATYAFSDGFPVAKAFKLLHGIDQKRIPGMEFFPLMLDICNKHKLKLTLLGSTNKVLNLIEGRINKEYPNLTITNKISPPFKQKWDNEKYIKAINNAKTNIVFVALGCPLQEKWMFENYKEINAVLLGVGGAFPVYAGEIPKCPSWMARNGLEWLYRLIKEPRRMWKRYFYTNTIFIKLLLRYLLFK